jgi:hypothetical protein
MVIKNIYDLGLLHERDARASRGFVGFKFFDKQ